MLLESIVIVDDDECNLQILDAILRRRGYEALGYTNPFAALEVIEWITPSLIITDLLMTSLNGFEMSERIHAMPHLADTPIVLMSAQADFLEFRRQPSPHSYSFLAKPIQQRDVLHLLDSVLSNARVAGRPASVYTVSER